MNRGSTWSANIPPADIPPDPISRAVDTWTMILEKPSTVTIQRKTPGANVTVSLPQQIVRLEVIQNIRGANEPENMWFDTSKQFVVLIGVKDHPFLPNTDVRRADLFFYLNLMWEVVEIINNVPGRLLANANVQP